MIDATISVLLESKKYLAQVNSYPTKLIGASWMQQQQQEQRQDTKQVEI